MFRSICLLAALTASAAAGPMCVSGTLASYEALGAGGCTFGPFNLTDFTFTQMGGTITIPDGDVMVNPTIGLTLGLAFSSNNFNVSGTDSADYVLSYTWDPGDIRSLEDVLNDPVSSPGLAQITTNACENAAFVGTVCPTTEDTISVSDNGITLNSPNTFTFASTVTTLGIREEIVLQGNGTGSADIDGFGNIATLPEPSPMIPLGLFALLLFRRLRLKRCQVGL